jgi:hypothetical protein
LRSVLIGQQRATELLRAWRQQPCYLHSGHDVVPAVARHEIRVDVVSVDERPDHFIAQAPEHGQLRTRLPIILNEERPVVRERVHRQITAGVALLTYLVRQSQKEVRE